MLRPTSPRVWLTESAAALIADAAEAGHPIEAGGLLLGVCTRGRPWIIEAVAVPSAAATGNFYELPAGARHDAVDRARTRDRRLGYIGDWHSHPANVGPSSVDVATMRELSADEEARCPHPVLFIARRAGDNYWLDARELAQKRLRKLRVIVAGGLPLESDNATPQPKLAGKERTAGD